MTNPYAPSASHLVFVYGTLKRGFANDHFLRGQTFRGEARTPAGFRLYRISDYPGLVADRADTAGVGGEIWEIDGPCLRRLDALEGLKEGLYTREPIPLLELFATELVIAYFYARDLAGHDAISGDWQEFRRRR